jgi:hypothetical protein
MLGLISDKSMRYLFLLLPVAVLWSCSVQKRKYQRGFYIASKHRTIQSGKNPVIRSTQPAETIAEDHSPSLNTNHGPVTAGAEKTIITGNTQVKRWWHRASDSCDLILFRDGREISGKVLEISKNEIRYRKCDLPDGPLFVSRKADIFMIRYANGTKETFQAEAPVTTVTPEKIRAYGKYADPKKVTADAQLSLILGIVGIVFFYYGSIHAIILGSRVLKIYEANPGKIEGEGMARAGIILGVIKLALLLLMIILLILFI